jgi:hypothetical protein
MKVMVTISILDEEEGWQERTMTMSGGEPFIREKWTGYFPIMLDKAIKRQQEEPPEEPDEAA